MEKITILISRMIGQDAKNSDSQVKHSQIRKFKSFAGKKKNWGCTVVDKKNDHSLLFLHISS